jgi:FkbM family methyltransferase
LDVSRYDPAGSSAAQFAKALDLAGIDTVFDIGANSGQFASKIREYGYTGTIVSFEPLSSARNDLIRVASRDPAWLVHRQAAIGDRDGETTIYISGNSVSSSILPMLQLHSNAAAESGYIDSERVPLARLDSVAGSYLTHETKLFIKIDTQGYEWPVLDGASETLRKARGLACELSLQQLYGGQRLWRDIVDRLDDEGFILYALQKGFTNLRTGQTLQMDGIFLRPDLLKNA